MKKSEYEFADASAADVGPAAGDTDLGALRAVHATLKAFKNQIAHHYKNKAWDTVKRYTNTYELVYSTGNGCGGRHLHPRVPVPVSRSFFKLWEILHDAEGSEPPLLPTAPNQQQRRDPVVFLAEGPGGFVEAFCHFCEQRGRLGAYDLLCNTLVSDDRSVPSWKVPTPKMRDSLEPRALRFLTGADGTGDLYSLANLDAMCAEARGAALVTADGGFDFSGDFNCQEEASLPLLAAEVAFALAVQRPGGGFVLKLFDVSALPTMALLNVLRRSYARVTLTKPFTSRQANSEKYVVCRGFVGAAPGAQDALRAFLASRDTAALLEALPVPRALVAELEAYVVPMVSRQIANISKTLAFINISHSQPFVRDCIDHQRRKASAWVAHYFEATTAADEGGDAAAA